MDLTKKSLIYLRTMLQQSNGNKETWRWKQPSIKSKDTCDK